MASKSPNVAFFGTNGGFKNTLNYVRPHYTALVDIKWALDGGGMVDANKEVRLVRVLSSNRRASSVISNNAFSESNHAELETLPIRLRFK